VLRHGRLRELDPVVLHDLLRLRVDVFVVEQACPYPDIDGRDAEPDTVHWWAEEHGEVLACLRVLTEDEGHRIGRVELINAALAGLTRPVVLSAQTVQVPWYERFGFVVDGPGFLEDDIPHTPMRLA
jgi:ElaA protein